MKKWYKLSVYFALLCVLHAFSMELEPEYESGSEEEMPVDYTADQIAVLQNVKKIIDTAQGPSKEAKLYYAARRIRQLLEEDNKKSENQAFSLLNRLDTNSTIINALAETFVYEDKTKATLALATAAGWQWLAQELENHENETVDTDREEAYDHIFEIVRKGNSKEFNFIYEYLKDLDDSTFLAHLDITGRDVLSYAAEGGNAIIIKELLSLDEVKNNINIKSLVGLTPLMYAIVEGHEKAVKALLDNGALVNDGDTIGNTPLMLAIVHGRNSLIPLLLEKNPNLEAKNDEGKTALTIAVQQNAPLIISSLLDKGVDVNTRDNEGNTPLMEAARLGDYNLVHRLLTSGAKADAQNDQGFTALMKLIENASNHTNKKLLLQTAKELVFATNVHKASTEEQTALSLAQEYFPELIPAIEEQMKVKKK